MSRRRTTALLALLVLLGGVAALVAHARMASCRDAAEVAARNLDRTKAALAQIRQWKSSPGRATAVTADASQLSARLREAATAAGLPDAPGSEPDNNLRRLGNSDYSEMSVYLRFEPLTLKQLTTFLHTLAKVDPSSRARQIELSPPPGATATDLWTADVTVGYLTYSPQKTSR